MSKILDRLWLLKEGAVVGLLIGLAIYYFNLTMVLWQIQKYFGAFEQKQLLWATIFIFVSLGIIFDAIYKPNK